MKRWFAACAGVIAATALLVLAGCAGEKVEDGTKLQPPPPPPGAMPGVPGAPGRGSGK